MSWLGIILEFAGFGAGIWWFIWSAIPHYSSGTLIGSGGKRYSYVIGDRLHYGYLSGTFNGVDIVLPDQMILPNIYLDGHNGEHLLGPRHFMPGQQIVQLEGNFNQSFSLYAPAGYETLALTIVTPDVMQTLQDKVIRGDVEIYQDHIRLTVRRGIFKHIDRQTELLASATALIAEIDHKLDSWTIADSMQAGQTRLVSESNSTVIVGGRRYRLSGIIMGLLYGFLGLIIWTLVLTNLEIGGGWSKTAIVNIILAFLFFPCLWVYIVIGLPRGWLNWLGKLMDATG